MKQKRILLQGRGQVELIATVLGNLELDGSIEVIIRDYKKDRSFEQNRLYWKWLGIIAAESEDTSASMHEFCKRKFLVPILATKKPFYDLLMVVARGGTEDDRKELAKVISTTRLTVKQFTEYLNEIEKHAASLSIVLPQP